MSLMCLFIGGPADGERRMVEDHINVYSVDEFPPLPNVMTARADTLKVTRHHYVRRKMTNGWYVFLHDSLHPRQIVDKLIRGYRSTDPL
jgi:hypothetical protein